MGRVMVERNSIGGDGRLKPSEISKLSDKELAEKLREHSFFCGPIVPSTRSVYEKKLYQLEKVDARASNPSSSHFHKIVRNRESLSEHLQAFKRDVWTESATREKPRNPKMSSINSPVYQLSESSEQSFYGSVNDKSMDIISEWTSYSIVGVFLLFFSIIAAFYIYSRMRFTISEDLGPVSISNLGVNLNELTLPICDLEEKEYCTNSKDRIKPSLLVFRYILNHIEDGLLDYYCSKEIKRSDPHTYSISEIFKALQAKRNEIDEKIGQLLPPSNDPSVTSKMLFDDYFSEAISFIANYNLHLKVHSRNGEQFITVDKSYPISLSMGCKLRSFLWRTGKYTALVIIIISIFFSIIKYISHKKKIQNEDQAAIQDLVKKSIELLQSPDEPRSMPVINIRDTLLTPTQRKDSRWKRIWSRVVEFIENNDYHINSAIEEIDGEEFKTWKWCGSSTTKDRLNEFRMDATTMRTGTIEWQGSAFDSTSDTPGGGSTNQTTSAVNGSINSVPIALTEFLKLRNIPNKNNSSSWKTQLRNAIIEKCTAYSPSKYHGILHIDFGSADKEELFIYLKCDSIESATNNFAALHGWWCERHLVSVKFLKADRYYEKFPEAISASTPLQILNIDP